MKGKCRIKIKGGARCGRDLVPDKNYCKDHAPAPVPKVVKLTTYAVGETKFRGEKTVKTKEYDDYITSDFWKEKAALEKKKNPNCALCNRTGNLHVHHRTYVRCGKEEPGDLIVICSDCHRIFHDHFKYDGRVGHFKPK